MTAGPRAGAGQRRPLADAVALVTGAGSGIGRAISLRLAAEGARLCLVGRKRDKLEATAGAVPPGASPAVVSPMDLGVEAEVDRLGHTVEAELGGLDVLVLAAGELAHGATTDLSVEVFDRLFQSNVRANHLLLRRLAPLLKARRGQVVFINSSAGLGARPGGGAYGATKAALKALADAFRAEVNADGVRVLSVYPGRTATPRMEKMYDDSRKPYDPGLLLQPEDVASVVLNALTLPRTAEVTEINLRPMAKSY